MSQAAAESGLGRLFSDERLTRRAVGGDERAFAAIFRRYHQSLYRFCLTIVGNPEDAQDALQNTMMKVLRALPGEERKIELKPWLYRIAHNESIDLLRRRRESRELDVEQIAPGYGLAEDAATRERLRQLIADLKELPERQRGILVMRELGGLGFEEIGSALDCSGAVARQTLYEARQSLRQMEEGREMSCATVTKALSDGDGRVIRRRDVRAHLRACPDCRAFREATVSRERDFAALSPLPAVAAAGMLQGLLGGSHGAGAGLAATLSGGAAKTIGASAAAKGVATAAVVAAIGVTAADRTGVIHLGLPGDRGAKQVQSAPAGGGAKGGAGSPERGGEARGGAGSGAATGTGRSDASKNASQAGRKAGAGAHRGSGSGHQVRATATQPAKDHPSGRGHEVQLPEAAVNGQAGAAEHQASAHENGSANSGGRAEAPSQPAHPTAPASATPAAPPKEAPASTAGTEVAESAAPAEAPAAENGPPEGSPGSGKRPENLP